jgi:hypothetical protein
MPVIKITEVNGKVVFQPDDPVGSPGQALEVDRGEDVSWNNETSDSHWPWPTDAQGKLLKKAEAIALGFYLTDEVPAGKGSRPIYNVAPRFSPIQQPPPPPPELPPATITYVCRRHRKERGSIIVRNP